MASSIIYTEMEKTHLHELSRFSSPRKGLFLLLMQKKPAGFFYILAKSNLTKRFYFENFFLTGNRNTKTSIAKKLNGYATQSHKT
jgi:hypothetical protein